MDNTGTHNTGDAGRIGCYILVIVYIPDYVKFLSGRLRDAISFLLFHFFLQASDEKNHNFRLSRLMTQFLITFW